jgi:hypothetical protein
MADEHSNQAPLATSVQKSIQLEPAAVADAGASAKTKAAAKTGAEKSGVVELSPLPTGKAEKPKASPGLTAVLEASRIELDRLLAETQTIHERSWRIIHTLLEDSQLRASQAVDACLARFEKEIQERISGEISLSLENLDVEADARLTARLDQALANAKQRQVSIEQDLAVAVAENRKQLDQISTRTVEGLRDREQNLLADLQKEAEKQLARLAAAAGDINDNIRRLGETAGTQLQAGVEKAVGAFQSRIEQVWQEMVSRAEKRLAETAQNSTAELAKQARQLVEREMSDFFSNALRRFDSSSNARSSKQNS